MSEWKRDVKKYRELDKQMKKRCNEANEHWINTQYEEIEANTGVNSKTVHQKIKEVIGKKATGKTGCKRSKDGDILIEKEDILNRWSETSQSCTMMTEAHHLSSIMMKGRQKDKKKGKAAGPDQIPPEMLTTLGEFGIKEITKVLNIIHDTGEIPTDLNKSVCLQSLKNNRYSGM